MSSPEEKPDEREIEEPQHYSQDAKDLIRWARSKHMTPIGEGCFRTTPLTKE